MYGDYGVQVVDEFIEKKLITKDDKGLCKAVGEGFRTSNDIIVRNFKLTADYIKPQAYKPGKAYNPYHINFSESVSPETYQKIVKIQSKAMMRISKLVSEDNRKGPIPLIVLMATDTLDSRSAREILEEESFQRFKK